MKEIPKRYINPFLSDEENEKANLCNNIEDEKFDNSLVDKNVTEFNLPDLIPCYEDNGFHLVKDICVDDGLPHRDRIECEKEHDKLLCNPDIVKDDIDSPFEGSYKNTCVFSVTKDENLPSIVQKSEMFDSDNSLQNGERKVDSDSIPPNNSSENDADQPLSEVCTAVAELELLVDDKTYGKKSAGTEAAKSNETKIAENKPGTNNDPQSLNELPLETKSAHNNDDMASDNPAVSNQLQRGGCESSFTIPASVSGLITYSGAISSAGSVSHRSDGSNTSVGSFAFPILQNEWNSSPVRMAKVNSRQSRKYAGWKQALMCCRF